jgi:hypothetical protein
MKMPRVRDAATESMIRNLKAKTGKSLAKWITVAKSGGGTKHREILGYLTSQHGLTHGYANLVALETLSGLTKDEGDPIEAQYAGDKAELRPLYEALVAVVRGFGKDVELAPKKAYVSLRRRKQFALIQPSTSKRLDVGMVLKETKAKGRLEASGSFNAMVTHRVRVEGRADLDAELIAWLRAAYDAS